MKRARTTLRFIAYVVQSPRSAFSGSRSPAIALEWRPCGRGEICLLRYKEAALAEPKEFGRRAVFGNRVTIDDELYARAKKCAELAGFSTTDEFIEHVLTKEIAAILGPGSGEDDTPEEIKKRLQGLGYIE